MDSGYESIFLATRDSKKHTRRKHEKEMAEARPSHGQNDCERCKGHGCGDFVFIQPSQSSSFTHDQLKGAEVIQEGPA